MTEVGQIVRGDAGTVVLDNQPREPFPRLQPHIHAGSGVGSSVGQQIAEDDRQRISPGMQAHRPRLMYLDTGMIAGPVEKLRPDVVERDPAAVLNVRYQRLAA